MVRRIDETEMLDRLEDTIADIEGKISGAYGDKITADQLYTILLNFDKMYYKRELFANPCILCFRTEWFQTVRMISNILSFRNININLKNYIRITIPKGEGKLQKAGKPLW